MEESGRYSPSDSSHWLRTDFIPHGLSPAGGRGRVLGHPGGSSPSRNQRSRAHTATMGPLVPDL